MKGFAATIISTLFASSLGLTQEERDDLQTYVDSSLCESGFFGQPGEQDFTNVYELLEIEYQSYTVYKVKSCEDDIGHWTGTQITLKGNDGTELQLSPLGLVDQGKCQTLELTGPLDAVLAGFYEDNEAVSSVRFRKNGIVKTYGDASLNDSQ